MGARLLLAVALSAAVAPGAFSKVFMSQEEALNAALGSATAREKRTAYLTEAQAAEIEALAGTAPPTRIVVSYAGGQDPNHPLTAYFDTHVVRTLPETIMVVVDDVGKTVRVDILSFDEPEDYLPKRRWLDQFQGRPLGDELSLKGGIRAVTGATLSSRAITDAVRRVLATHGVVSASAAAQGVKR